MKEMFDIAKRNAEHKNDALSFIAGYVGSYDTISNLCHSVIGVLATIEATC